MLHSPRLKYRENCIQTTSKILESICQQYNIKCRIFKISGHEPDELKPKAEEIEKSIQYDKTGDEEFDRLIHPLNLEQLSNIFKQKEALKQIVQLSKLPTITHKDCFMVLEDDAYILQEFQKNLHKLLHSVASETWDLLMLSVSGQRPSNDMKYNNLRDIVKILPGKEAYMIRPKAAEALLKYLDMIRYTFRCQLS